MPIKEQRELIYEYLSAILDIGELMLRSGAEVNRVEDTITRICTAYGASRVDVFTITSSIVVTMKGRSFGTVTQTRRISEQNYDLHRLTLLNQLSRSVCAEKPEPVEIQRRIDAILRAPRYGLAAQVGIYALISFAFSLFFGGSLQDALTSGIIGILIRLLEEAMVQLHVGRIFSLFVLALAGGFAAIAAVKAGIANNADMISIGNIMLLIPGIMLTNAIRDMVSGDTIAGLSRFAEAILLANIVVLGVTLASILI